MVLLLPASVVKEGEIKNKKKDTTGGLAREYRYIENR